MRTFTLVAALAVYLPQFVECVKLESVASQVDFGEPLGEPEDTMSSLVDCDHLIACSENPDSPDCEYIDMDDLQ